jgi:hypothetical protein
MSKSKHDNDAESFIKKYGRQSVYATTALAVTGIGAIFALSSRYKVCMPHQRMVRTGLGIKGILPSRKGFL